MSQRNCATSVQVATQSSSPLRKWTRRRPTCFQTENGAKRFHCAEVPFQPSFTGKEASGFRDTTFQNVMKCDVDTRKELYANVVVSSFQGTVVRMTEELTALAPSTMKVKVVALTRYGLADPSCLASSFFFFLRFRSQRASTMNLALPSNVAFAQFRATVSVVFFFLLEIDPVSKVHNFFNCAEIDLPRLIANIRTTFLKNKVHAVLHRVPSDLRGGTFRQHPRVLVATLCFQETHTGACKSSMLLRSRSFEVRTYYYECCQQHVIRRHRSFLSRSNSSLVHLF